MTISLVSDFTLKSSQASRVCWQTQYKIQYTH